MRWGGAILAVMAVAVLAGCGGGGSPSTTEEANSGPPPDLAVKVSRPLIERQIEMRNPVSLLSCHKATGRVTEADADPWKCDISLKRYEEYGGEILILVRGEEGQYEVKECDFVPIRVITSAKSVPKVPHICKLIH
jgi:hypothetical protein